MGDKYRELNGAEFWKSSKVYCGADYVFGLSPLRLSHLRLSHLYLIKKNTRKKKILAELAAYLGCHI